MYIPPAFKKTDLQDLHAFMERYNFATLVSQYDGAAVASHLPVLVDRTKLPYGRISGHFARANPHYQHVKHGTDVLVIFMGPHSYVSPTWYSERIAVPTWNYAVVHAYGRLAPTCESDLVDVLRRLVEKHEARSDEPWGLDPFQPEFASMLPEIAGFEISITELQGKFKLSQNRSQRDREEVIGKLDQSGDTDKRALADLMKKT